LTNQEKRIAKSKRLKWCTQSDANPSLFPNSLLTGKLTGNFAKTGGRRQFRRSFSEQIQYLLSKFPAQGNREFLRKNREFVDVNREFGLGKMDRAIWIADLGDVAAQETYRR
jgi:hypothetical protein